MLIAVALWLVARVAPHTDRAERNPLAWRAYGRPPVERPEPAPPATFTVSARLKSLGFAVEGLRFMLRNEHNAWMHLAATVLVVAAGLALRIEGPDWRWIAVAVLWVWFAEAINTAFETLCDVVCPGANEAVRIAKDVAAGAVLVSAIAAAILGAVTLMPYVARPAAGSAVDVAICRGTP